MIPTLKSVTCALVLGLSAGGLASAQAPANPAPATVNAEAKDTAKQYHRRDHRYDRRYDRHDRFHDRYERRHQRFHSRYDRPQHYRGYRHPSRYPGYYRHRYAPPACWSERRHSRYHGRPATVAVRVCRDRYGRHYEVPGSARLVAYLRVGYPHRYRGW